MRKENGITRLALILVVLVILVGIGLFISLNPKDLNDETKNTVTNEIVNETINEDVEEEIGEDLEKEELKSSSDEDKNENDVEPVKNEIVLLTNDQIAERNKLNQEQETESAPAENTKTEDIYVNSSMTFNGVTSMGGYITTENGEVMSISFDPSKYNIPKMIYDYNSDVKFRITYDVNDYTVYDCKVVDAITNEIIEDLSEENINRLYNIELGKEIIELPWTDAINLSDLKENEVYKCTADIEYEHYPRINNDLGQNVIFYTKKFYSDGYEKEAIMAEKIERSSGSGMFSSIEVGDEYSFMFKTATDEEILTIVDSSSILNLDGYNIGDIVEDSFEDYIYNNTEYDIVLKVKESSFYSDEEATLYTIPAGKIFGFDWMLSEISIENILY